MSDLPYRYEATFTVVLRGNGQHADGEGATATIRRVRELIATDRNVEDVQASAPSYTWPRRAS